MSISRERVKLPDDFEFMDKPVQAMMKPSDTIFLRDCIAVPQAFASRHDRF
jgi:hypothetical protein